MKKSNESFSYKYFENRDCKYYPCHKGIDKINCLFCYCPLYLKKNCPGSPEYIKGKNGEDIKDCSNCTFPHIAENYEKLIMYITK